MELHNIIEDIVIPQVEDIFDSIEKNDNPEKLCTCAQCRIDTACYVLNRTSPYYLVSNRGAARVSLENKERQQRIADITTMIWEGLKRINHNQRPHFSHNATLKEGGANQEMPVYNIPTITGRLFNGTNFAPLSDVDIELIFNGAPAVMKDGNWQNPHHLVSHTEGTFNFWPVPVLAEKTGERDSFEYTIRVVSDQFETLTHIFSIPVISEIQTSRSFSLGRTFKLPDLYMFPPGEAEKNLSLDAD